MQYRLPVVYTDIPPSLRNYACNTMFTVLKYTDKFAGLYNDHMYLTFVYFVGLCFFIV
jgi:hypothetical protein